MRLPATILQGILARTALTFLRISFGAVLVLSAWQRLQTGPAIDSASALEDWVQLLVGLTLVLGLLTRLSAVVALLLTVQSGLSRQPQGWSATGAETTWMLVAIALIVGAAGRTFGLDSLLARRWLRSPFW
jgi:uncharacterized membrane protein YphA (DoxX/SURF4 family)